MTHLHLACICGATLHAVDTSHELDWMAEEWRARHQGEGHGETDYLTATQQRAIGEAGEK